MLFVSHGLADIRYIVDKVAVMNKGEIVELKSATDIYSKATGSGNGVHHP